MGRRFGGGPSSRYADYATMSQTLGRRTFLATSLGAFATPAAARGSRLLHRDDFRRGLGQWSVETEAPSRIEARRGILDIDAPKGATLWFRERIVAPTAIDIDITAVSAGGPNDAVSDVNFFWMASDPGVLGGNPTGRRSGAFAEYDTLRTYYAGIGGNRNTSTRMRRYVGRAGERPLLPEHDLSAPGDLLAPNREMRIRIVTAVGRTALLRDGGTVFTLDDAQPYRSGWFALRTTQSHLRVRRFRVWRL
ncbi:DUF6250 domain-containing protein [Sphingomonas sp.]|uniref:DUF6250 domain-containing protein n=1 Tax=Sphingomonas sp. TaxID=28214 RepID=UPI002EDB892B